MMIRRLAAAFGAVLVLTAVGAMYGLRHGSFAAATGIDPLAADAVRVSGPGSDGRVISSRDAVLELMACLNGATYSPRSGQAQAEDGCLTMVFLRRGRQMAVLHLSHALEVGGRTYAVRGLDAARLHTLTGTV